MVKTGWEGFHIIFDWMTLPVLGEIQKCINLYNVTEKDFDVIYVQETEELSYFKKFFII